jgi:diguanylate cyclase (GGDEF)-like protein
MRAASPTVDVVIVKIARPTVAARLDELLSHGHECAVLFCDLDGFKAVNDRFGHHAGDDVLVELATRLRRCIPAVDVVSRIGGDEFLILSSRPTEGSINSLLDRVGEALVSARRLQGKTVTIGASVGRAVGSGETDPEDLIRRADHATYEEKRPAQRGLVL